MNVNQWIGVGHVCRDPEVKGVGNSTVAQFRLAVNRSYKKGDEWVEKTMFIDCDAWGHTAEKVQSSVQQGTEVFIRGRLELDEWKSADGGERRSKHKIYVLELQVGKKRKGGDDDGAVGANLGNKREALGDDDFPF